jgi:hypothetical protein
MSSMSTNIDDIDDPNAVETVQHVNNSPQIQTLPENQDMYISQVADVTTSTTSPPQDLYRKDVNSNISSNVSVYKDLKDSLFSESNILLFIIIIIAGLPQINEYIIKFTPGSLHNNMIINIIKAILLFLIYFIIVKYVF